MCLIKKNWNLRKKNKHNLSQRQCIESALINNFHPDFYNISFSFTKLLKEYGILKYIYN